MGLVDPWVGLGRVGSIFFSFWWVGSTTAKVLNISLKSLFLSDTMTLFLICTMISKEHKYVDAC